MIRLKEVTLKGIFEKLNICFSENKVSALLGQSGSGKTTILRLVNGLTKPETGEILLDEKYKNVKAECMGYVTQDGALFPHLTVKENILLVPKYLKKTATEIKERLEYLLLLTSFPEDALHRFPSQISGGQAQRAALIRALFPDPPILLLDEPLSALDPIIRASLQADLKNIFMELKKTVLLVTHDIYEAAYLADEIFLLQKGKLLQKGSFENLVNSPAEPFVLQFIASQRHSVHL